jgi:hypothetical protein
VEAVVLGKENMIRSKCKGRDPALPPITIAETVERWAYVEASPEFFSLLGLTAILGRIPLERERDLASGLALDFGID